MYRSLKDFTHLNIVAKSYDLSDFDRNTMVKSDQFPFHQLKVEQKNWQGVGSVVQSKFFWERDFGNFYKEDIPNQPHYWQD